MALPAGMVLSQAAQAAGHQYIPLPPVVREPPQPIMIQAPLKRKASFALPPPPAAQSEPEQESRRRRRDNDVSPWLSPYLAEKFPVQAQQLKRIQELEEDLERRMRQKRRQILKGEPVVWKKRTLRLWISSEVVPGPPGAPMVRGGNSEWVLRVEGKLLNPPPDHIGSPELKFSNFFENISVVLQEDAFPTCNMYVWNRGGQYDASFEREEFDCLTLKNQANVHLLAGRKRFVCSVQLNRRVQPGQPLPVIPSSVPLRRILRLVNRSSAGGEPMSTVVAAVVEYARMNGLLGTGIIHGDKSIMLCDDALTQIFRVPSMNISEIENRLQEHLSPGMTIQVDAIVSLDEQRPSKDKHFDIEVDVATPARYLDTRYASILQRPVPGSAEAMAENALERRSQHLKRLIAKGSCRLQLLEELAEDPLGTIEKLAASQKRSACILEKDVSAAATQTPFTGWSSNALKHLVGPSRTHAMPTQSAVPEF